MLELIVDDRAHALRHRLVLEADIADAGEAFTRPLRRAINLPVIVFIGAKSPAAVPAGVIRQIVMRPGQMQRHGAVLSHARDRGPAPLPMEMHEHGVLVVHRHPGARTEMSREGAGGRLRPEWEEEIGNAPISLSGIRRPIGGIGGAPGASATW